MRAALRTRCCRLTQAAVRRYVRTVGTSPLPTGHDAKYLQARWQEHWVQLAQVPSTSKEGTPFTMVLPPPNITGRLHLGHALTVAVEDVLVRWARLDGRRCKWTPGTDHAGIATQVVVEKMLARQGHTNISRDQLLAACHEWQNKRQTDIREQLQRMCPLLDWRNEYFTMNERFTRAVHTAFARLHADGLIVRERRLVNYCPMLRSTISDAEVDAIQYDTPGTYGTPPHTLDVGWMYTIDYALSGDDTRTLPVATTRPETMFADVALAVNPGDARYVHLIGQHVRHPLAPHRILPIVADTAVHSDKGTGVLKVTPGHDRVDFDIGKRHGLPLDIHCFDEHSQRLANTGTVEWDGMHRFEARMRVAERLGARRDAFSVTIPTCSRTGDVVELRPMYQWFLKCRELGARTVAAINAGRLTLHPSTPHTGVWQKWVDDTDEWCLSRQLVWGHRVPAYRRCVNGKDEWIISVDDNRVRDSFEQDTDVLDTWFSAALIPLVTAGWPDAIDARLYPLTLMHTGYDILGFWVVRMAMLCMHLTDGHTPPFGHVLFNGLLRDAEGRKMSKSIGNVIDPLDVIDGISLEHMLSRVDEAYGLSEHERMTAKSRLRTEHPSGMAGVGTDALRFGLLRHDVLAMDVNVDLQLCTHASLTCNKLFNAFRYSQSQLWQQGDMQPSTRAHLQLLLTAGSPTSRLMCTWILSRLRALADSINAHMAEYHFARCTATLVDFIWNDLCAVFLEMSKHRSNDNDTRLYGAVMAHAFDVCLQRLSIFMPNICTELRTRLPTPPVDDDCFVAVLGERDTALDARMTFTMRTVSSVRSLRTEYGFARHIPLTGWLSGNGGDVSAQCESAVLQQLTNFTLVPANESAAHLIEFVNDNTELYVTVERSMNAAVLERVRTQLAQRIRRREQFVNKRAHYTSLVEKQGDNSAGKRDKFTQLIAGAEATIKQIDRDIHKMTDMISRLEA